MTASRAARMKRFVAQERRGCVAPPMWVKQRYRRNVVCSRIDAAPLDARCASTYMKKRPMKGGIDGALRDFSIGGLLTQLASLVVSLHDGYHACACCSVGVLGWLETDSPACGVKCCGCHRCIPDALDVGRSKVGARFQQQELASVARVLRQ